MPDDTPLDNFGAVTEVAAPPAESPTEPQAQPDEQTTQPTEATGSEASKDNVKSETTEDNPKADETVSEDKGRPEKRDRLQNRFGELTGTIKQQNELIQRMEADLARSRAMAGIKPLEPDENGYIDPRVLQDHQTQIARAEAQAESSTLRMEIERERVANRFDSEGTQIEKLASEKFGDDQTHLDIIKEMVEESVNQNINNLNALKQISPLKIAERYIKGIEAERRKAQSSTAQNVQTLQAEQAVTPSNAPAVPDDDLDSRVADIKF